MSSAIPCACLIFTHTNSPWQRIAREHGLILVDTKYEFGKGSDGAVLLIDEVFFLTEKPTAGIHLYKAQLDGFKMIYFIFSTLQGAYTRLKQILDC